MTEETKKIFRTRSMVDVDIWDYGYGGGLVQNHRCGLIRITEEDAQDTRNGRYV